jgi:hypothetical protein
MESFAERFGNHDGRGSLGRLRISGRMILKIELMKIIEHLFMVYLMRQSGSQTA